MALDLFKGITRRNWAREPDPLVTAPAKGPRELKPGEKALKNAKEFDSRVKIRPAAGKGAVVTAKIKWG